MLTQDYLSLRLGRLRCGEEWSPNRTGLTFVFPKGGSGRFLSGTSAERLTPGDVLVADGKTPGSLSVPEQGEMVFWWFSVCSEHLYSLFVGAEICLVQDVLEGFKRSKVYPAADATAREIHRLLADVPPQFNLDHRSQLLRVAAVILDAEFKNVPRHRVGFVRSDEHMIQVFEKLSASEILDLSVGELAGRFGCSRRHLNRLFHQHFGVSVATLRMEMRLSKAVSLLRDPNAKIIRVAEECGFNHLGLFNTCFKRRFGISPGQWRKEDVPAQVRTTVLGGGAPDCPLRTSGLCPWLGRDDAVHGAVPSASPHAKLQSTPVLFTGFKSNNGNAQTSRQAPRPRRISRG